VPETAYDDYGFPAGCPSCGEDELYSLHFAFVHSPRPPTLSEYYRYDFKCRACAWEGPFPYPHPLRRPKP
jgi:hypothetical protein